MSWNTRIEPLKGLLIYEDGSEVMEGPNILDFTGTGWSSIVEAAKQEAQIDVAVEIDVNNQWAVLPSMQATDGAIGAGSSGPDGNNQCPVHVVQCSIPEITFSKMSWYLTLKHDSYIDVGVYDVNGDLIAETGWGYCNTATGFMRRTLSQAISVTQQDGFLALANARMVTSLNPQAVLFETNALQKAFLGNRMGIAANKAQFYTLVTSFSIVHAVRPDGQDCAITTASNHGYSTGDRVAITSFDPENGSGLWGDQISGIKNTPENPEWTITVTTPDSFSLNGSAGAGGSATINPPGVESLGHVSKISGSDIVGMPSSLGGITGSDTPEIVSLLLHS